MSNGIFVGVAVIVATIIGATVALYIAGRRGMRRRTLDERPIIAAEPNPVIVPQTDVRVILPPPVPPAAVPA